MRRNFTFAAFVLMHCVTLFVIVACHSPSQASPLPTLGAPVVEHEATEPLQWRPLHHNIPSTFVGHPEGRTIWLCATQLRTYNPYDGPEEDHYLQYEPCPIVPIP